METQLFPFLSTIEYAGKADNISKSASEHNTGSTSNAFYWVPLILDRRQ